MKRVYGLVGLVMFGSALLLSGCGGGGSGGPGLPGTPGAPGINPANFTTRIDNPFFPLVPGTTFVYEGNDEEETLRDEFVVTSQTKVIQGVTCRVVRDKAFVAGELVEDTNDWFAQDKEGNVWYFGEDVKNIENGVVVNRNGSFQAGVNGAQAGIIMKANPKVGDTYFQERAPGIAEDEATVLALNSTVTVPRGTFTNCLKTRDFTRLEPNVAEEKYYARGVGFVLAVKVKGGNERLALKEIIRPN